MALKPKHRQFVEEYLRCWNASEAARRVGYSQRNADVNGPRLLVNAGIQEEIERRIAETKVSADEVLLRLADQARGSMADFVTVGPAGGVTVDLQKAERAGLLHLVHRLEETKYGLKIELYDAQAALITLGKGYALWREQEPPPPGQVNVIVVRQVVDDGQPG